MHYKGNPSKLPIVVFDPPKFNGPCEKQNKGAVEKMVASRELTYSLQRGAFEDDFPFPKVGYVSFLEGRSLQG